MDLKEIRQLIKIVEGSDINEFELEEGGTRLKISKKQSKNGSVHPAEVHLNYPNPPVAPTPMAANIAAPVSVPVIPASAAEPVLASNIYELRSPMVGTFYRAPSPDADPYVEVGDTVSVGQTLCIVEAMKLMNEIECEVNGKITKVLIDNAQPVEYNQVLFLIEKS
jgi:acetyl-CoA carboxylase biotin carboxyl carrier protein